MSSLVVKSPDHIFGVDRQPVTLVDLLEWRARFQPERVAYTLLVDGETERISLSWSELHRKARLIGQRLTSIGAAGERVVLLYPSDLEYVAAFFGCLHAGAVAVPAYPPRLNRTLHRLRSIVADSQATLALSISSIRARIEPLCAQFPHLRTLSWLTTDDLEDEVEDEWRNPTLTGDTLAFLQYTSGSTSQPKGVMVSHGNLLHNQQMIQRAFEQTESSIIVGWLPLYHDMGLIGNVLQTLFVGARCVLMSPTAFLQSPFRWLQAISRFKATTSGGPNFAYDLCVRKVSIEQRAQLDLNSWKVAFNGAEPIRPDTLERFAEAFRPCGFNPESFHPCYGLAEATLFVSGKTLRGRPRVESFDAVELLKNRSVNSTGDGREDRLLVSCGASLFEQKVVIVNPESLTECGPGEVGEVWVSGQSIAGGYWNQPESTRQTFQAKIDSDDAETFLRTGDLGFLHGGELYVTGRLKDLIIIRGLNHYPQDIEKTAEQSHPSLRAGCGAAFSLEIEDEERLVIVQEVERHRTATDREIIEAIRQRVSEEHEVQVYAVSLIRQGSIAKTSSGKIRRNACRADFVNGELILEAEWREAAKTLTEAAALEMATQASVESVESLEGWLQSALAVLLRVDTTQIDINQPITRYGLDSLMAVELSHSIEDHLGFTVALPNLLEGVSISELGARLRRLSSEKRDSSSGIDSTETNPIDSSQPLSSSQQSLWFLHQLAPDDPTYNLAFAARIRAGLDVNSLRSAFQALVDRHASLRTTFAACDGEPEQQLFDHSTIYFEEHDALHWDQAVLDDRLVVESQRPFDLEHGPLLKVHLFTRSAGERVLLLTAHHIIVDLWSLTVLMNELAILYRAEQSLAPADLPPLTRQHLDYVRWQNNLLQSETGESHRRYWQKQLAGPLPVLALPTDRPRPHLQTYRGAAHTFRLDPELTRCLKVLSKEKNATLYMTLLAAFQALLYRYTGQEEILVGSPTSGRSRGWLAGLVGYLVNPVVLRAELSGEQPFAEFLEQVRRTVLAAFEHQDYPFALQVKDLQPERDASRSPLFQVMFALQKSHLRNDQWVAAFAIGDESAQIPLGDVVLESVALPQRTARFDLTLMMAEIGEQLGASLEYNTDLFDAATIERMSEQFGRLLESIVTNPEMAVSRLAILGRKEAQQLLIEWNDTGREYRTGGGLHRLFEAQVERTPLATAVVAGLERLTYLDLSERANRLARRLRRLGVAAESRAGILLERSAGMVVALLGVLKAGGCYVPLDPQYPQERLAFMMKDAGLKVLLTTRQLAESLSLEESAGRMTMVFVDEEVQESGNNLEIEVSERQLAYLIYTSGSTGQPKGVAIEHASATAFVHWASEIFDLQALAGVLFSTSICFDLSIFELFVTLNRGGQIILAGNALELAELPASSEVTLINTVPSSMAELVRMGAVPDSVRVVNLAGEALSRELVAEIYKATQVEKVYNLYGPTEDTTYSTFTLAKPGERVTIGRPVANTRVYVLDDQWQPVPVGVVGDLYIGGAGLARGYWRRPELSAEKFIPDSFSRQQGARLYQTGDKARYLTSGDLEFLGRADHQVKVRGYRIELGEIESVLRQHELVREAVVVAREQAGEEKRLVAYVVADRMNVSELRGWLNERLPGYMAPAAFVLMEELPLTPNGKLDRKALPAPDFNTLTEESLTAPRTQVEEVLLCIWADVLGVEHFGIHDNFFELGGHSLMATRLISRVRNELNVEVPLSQLFESPTVARLAESVEEAMRAGQGVRYTPVELAPRNEPLPLSFAQQRLWFLDQVEPGSPFYNISVQVRLRGRLNEQALERSFGEIVNRHEVLRTRFEVIDGQPGQMITPAFSWTMPRSDLRELAEAEREREVEKRAAAEAQTPFDLAVGRLLRTTLLQLRDEEYVLLLTMHHIISDAWSVGILARELTVLYGSFAAGQPSPLPELGVQYADFAGWQHHWLQGEALATQVAYWRQQLAGAPALLELPTDRARPAVQTFQGDRETLVLTKALTESLKSISRQEGATLFMTLLAAFNTLLFRYTGQPDIVVGTPIAGRNRAEIEGLIGFFVNTQAIRTQLTGELSFKELLAQVRGKVLEAHARQDLPFEKLVEELQPERSLSHSPIFQVMFALQNVPLAPLELEGLTVTLHETAVKTSKFDVSLSWEEHEDGLAGVLEYNTDLFDAATMRRLLGHYRRLLEDVVRTGGPKLGDLQLMTTGERRQLLVEWNDTGQRLSSSDCVHQQFERWAAATPAAAALLREEQTLSYGELNRRANAVAHHLRRLGLGAESIAGICVERSFEMVVGVLGILKAGAAYVPLDPNYPRERLSFMLEDCGASVLLTQKRLLEKLPLAHRASAICLDEDWEAGAYEETQNPTGNRTADHLAYVIYTSGSTGRPKGVGVTHAALLNLVSWHRSAFEISAADRATLLAGVGFDASVWELWPYLCCGAGLDLPTDEVRSSPAQLRDWLWERQVTITFVPTPVAEPMLGLEWPGPSKLRKLLTGGDRLHAWPSASLPFEVVNNYGPTENTVVSTSGLVSSGEGAAGKAPALGRPISNVKVYLVDGRGEPVAVGVAGELWVGGGSLARGYLNRAEMTAELFVPDGLSGKAGARLYRTGDLARYLPDGGIEFLGRIGSQVKIRGHRIELGEIETALREAAGVREAVVQCREARAAEPCLVAYVVPDEAGAVTSNDLRSRLREKLPEYMVPASFVMLTELPITDNGKIDRRALPAPAPTEVTDDAATPRTPTEELLSNIWTEILHLRRVGLHENFFELGGHSLLATQVISRVRETFSVELPVRVLFECPTIAELALSVEKALQSETGVTVAPIARVSREQNLPLSFAQQRLWFLDKLSSRNTSYNIQVAVRLKGPLDHLALERSLNEIIKRHEALRTTFAVRDGLPVQVIAPEYAISLPLVDLSAAPPGERESSIALKYAEEGRRAFDLGKLPLLRFHLLKFGETEHVLLLTMHHIISDGWSMGVITNEVASLYKSFSTGQPSPLPELAVQYADFAHWQREWLKGEVLDGQLAYWKSQLGYQLPTLELPADHARPTVQSFRGERRLFTLPAELSESLQALSRREGVTLYMLMLAAFKVLLYRYSAQDDIVVGTDIANRNRSEIEPLIGFFANQLVLRTDLSGNPTFRGLLRRVREVTLGAYAHQDLPFERLVEELQPERDLSRNPLFQVMFIFQNNPMPAMEIGTLAIEHLEMTEATTAFDLSLALRQTSQGEISGSVRYSTDIFDVATIERMIGHYKTLLCSVVADSGARLNSLEIFTEAENQQKAMNKEERKELKLAKLLVTKPKAVKLSEQKIVRESRLNPQMSLPIVMQPEYEGVDLVSWARQNRDPIEGRLHQCGAMLFRGFDTRSLSSFEQFARAVAPSLMAYGERSSPRHVLSGNIYTSTDHPADQHILLHNEQSYTLNWPMKIWFFCLRPAREGGRTPIADSRRILSRLPSPLVEKFVQKQVMYVRNYGDRLGLPWQEAFQTTDKRVVEEHCRRDSIDFEWKDENRLRTKQIRPAIRTHPRTGEKVWFNHAVFFNIHSLDAVARESLRAGVDDMDLPFNTFYGDGSSIEPSVIELIYDTYRQEQVVFEWQTGDILMLDNMLVAHGREPFVAPREIAVAMAEPNSQLKSS